MPSSILAAIDLAVSSDQVLAAAREYAEAFSAKVYLVHVAELGPTSEAAVMFPSSIFNTLFILLKWIVIIGTGKVGALII